MIHMKSRLMILALHTKMQKAISYANSDVSTRVGGHCQRETSVEAGQVWGQVFHRGDEVLSNTASPLGAGTGKL